MGELGNILIFVYLAVGVVYGWRWGVATDSVDEVIVFVMTVTVVAFIWPLVGLLRLVRGKPFWPTRINPSGEAD